MNIAILGFGTVGSGVYEICKNKNLNINVVKILDTPEKIQNSDLNILTSNYNEILFDKNIDLMVETIGGLEPSYSYIIEAIKNNKHIVTANKAVVAKYFEEFTSLASKYNVKFMCEASVGGGIPILNGLKKAKQIDTIKYLYGIFNGTSNFILDNMFKTNSTFNEALEKAQELGYAELDPSADIDGFDIKNKIIISSNIAYNTLVNNDFPIFSMRNITLNDILYFKEHQKTIKYIGESITKNNFCETMVIPVIFPEKDIESTVSLNNNLITIFGDTIGELKFFGQGAGKLPTANAIIQDILDIINNNFNNYKSNKKYNFSNKLMQNIYLIKTKFHHIIPDDMIENIDNYGNITYIYTKKTNLSELLPVIDKLKLYDDKLFIAKLFNKENYD